MARAKEARFRSTAGMSLILPLAAVPAASSDWKAGRIGSPVIEVSGIRRTSVCIVSMARIALPSEAQPVSLY